MNSLNDVWELIKEHMSQELNPITIKTWFDEVSVVTMEDSAIVLHCPNKFKKDTIEARFVPTLKKAAKEIFSADLEVKLLDDDLLAAYHGIRPDRADTIEGSEGFTFETFVVGPQNKLAYAAARATAEKTVDAYNPLFIYGDSGLGKTHLLYAIAHLTRKVRPEVKITYIKGEDFINEFIELIRAGRGGEFRAKYRESDMLLVDDIQFVAGKQQVQDEFFHTFNTLYNSHKQIVCASDRIPQDMPGLEKRLVSRFEWGLTVDITPPDLQTRVAILAEKQQSYSRKLPNEILEYLAQRIKSNVRNLEGSLLTLQAYLDMVPLQHYEEVTKALVDKVVGNKFEADAAMQLTVNRIQEFVAHRYDVRIQDLKGKCRQSEITVPRQIAMYLSRKMTEKSLPEIAAGFDKSHPTVIHSISVVEKRIEDSEDFRQEIADLERKIYENA